MYPMPPPWMMFNQMPNAFGYEPPKSQKDAIREYKRVARFLKELTEERKKEEDEKKKKDPPKSNSNFSPMQVILLATIAGPFIGLAYATAMISTLTYIADMLKPFIR